MGDNGARLLIVGGLAMAALGGLLLLGKKLPWLRLGHLPGDIAIQRDGFGFYFPITTMLLISAVATAVFWIVGAFKR